MASNPVGQPMFLSKEDYKTAVWCDTCLLPSVITFTATIVYTHGVAGPMRYRACQGCDQWTMERAWS
jgi:hypothetical protein